MTKISSKAIIDSNANYVVLNTGFYLSMSVAIIKDNR